VSSHITRGAPDWLPFWRHNQLGFYDTVALAESVIPAGEAARYEVLGYRFLDREIDGGIESPWTPPVAGGLVVDAGFVSVGFDAVNRTGADFLFECSPLSCNYAAKTMAHNEHCLFASLEEAVAGAVVFSRGGWEPGRYYVAEVLRRFS
jgi:hypothetical protein